jgi:hypothetical protein
MTLDELVRQLSNAYGARLQCVALYGSAARGAREHDSTRSDLNVLAIVDDIDMEHLKREAAVARAWKAGGNPPPLTLTMSEWRESADIFPIEYTDILAHHRVLHGALPAQGIEVKREDLRIQLEHEVRSKLLRLRHEVLSSSADAQALLAIMADSAGAVMVLVRAALRLAGEEPAADSATVLEQLQSRTGLDVAVLRRVLRHSRGEQRMTREAATQEMEAYLASVGALGAWVNAQ